MWQITVTVHGPAHDGVAFDYFVEHDVLFERTEHDEETPIAKSRVIESSARPKSRMLTEEAARCFDCCEVSFCDINVRIFQISAILPLHVRDEIVRLADVHEADGLSDCARSRMPVKSDGVSGVVGLSAVSSNHFSNSGVTSNGLCCWSRTERTRSLMSFPGVSQTPARTWLCRKSSTSRSSAMFIGTSL